MSPSNLVHRLSLCGLIGACRRTDVGQADLKKIAQKNQIMKNYIGSGCCGHHHRGHGLSVALPPPSAPKASALPCGPPQGIAFLLCASTALPRPTTVPYLARSDNDTGTTAPSPRR